LLTALIVVAVLALALAVLAVRSQFRAGPTLAGRTVVVHTRRPDDQTFRGILHAQYADRWTLRDACLVTGSAGEQPIGGVQHIPVANIAWAQELDE
jgi:hypothetical protein